MLPFAVEIKGKGHHLKMCMCIIIGNLEEYGKCLDNILKYKFDKFH